MVPKRANAAHGRTNHPPLRKAFSILQVLAREGRPIGAPDLGAELGMNRQTVHRFLGQLEEIGMVRRDVERERYEVGPALADLGMAAITASQFASLRRAVLEQLVENVHETANLGVLDGAEVVYIERVECDWPLRLQLGVGSRLPAYCTAIGKLLLANLPENRLEKFLDTVRLQQFTPNTLIERHALLQELEAIRERGYSINNQEDTIGLLAVAVPVRDPSGRIVAGVAVHGPEVRLSMDRLHALVPELTEAAEAIGKLMFEDA